MRLTMGMDGRRIQPLPSGIGEFTRQLARSIGRESADDQELILFVHPQENLNLGDSTSLIETDVPIGHDREEYYFPTQIDTRDVDVFIGPGNFLPEHKPCPFVSMVHDLCFWQYPEKYPEHLRSHFERAARKNTKLSDLIFTHTGAIKQQLAEFAPNLEVPVRVAYHDVPSAYKPLDNESDSLPEKLSGSVSEPFILFVSQLQPLKDPLTLLKAFEQIADQCPHDLVLVGNTGWASDDVQAHIEESSYRDRIHTPGMILENRDLCRIYNKAELFVFPSLCEGFGRPLIEAMRCETPVISSDIPVLKETGGDAPKYFEAGNENALSQTMEEVINNDDLRREMIRRGTERADYFNGVNPGAVFLEEIENLID